MTIARLLSEALAADELPATGDVLSVGLPFLTQLHALHQSGRVSGLSGTDGITYDGSTLRLDRTTGDDPRGDPELLRRLERSAPGIEVARRIAIDHGRGDGLRSTTSRDVFDAALADTISPERPMLVVGYRAWEQYHGVADALTDVHLAGLVLTSYALGLDLDLVDSVHELAFRRHNLRSLNGRLHPVVAGVLAEMIDPDRHERPPDLAQVIARLEHHRDLPADLDLDDAYASDHGWRRAVLSALRDRVFDLSRRNKALYFRPSSSAISLTEASVPLLLDIERIKPGDLLTWTGEGAASFRSGRQVDLAKWCRFEESPHLAPGLDKLISTERKLRAEHGQGRLRLIIAFLRWVDPETGETVNSPLLTLPAELTRKKGVTHRYRVAVDGDAEVNPVLRHVFRTRFAITLPEEIESDPDSIAAFVGELESAVRATEPSVEIELVDTPRINLIRRRAQLRVDAYLKRRAQTRAATGRWRRQDHSYETDDWRPLGLALYRRFVEPTSLPFRDLAGAAPRPQRPHFAMPPTPTRDRGQTPSAHATRDRGQTPSAHATRDRGQTPSAHATRDRGQTPSAHATRVRGQAPSAGGARDRGQAPSAGGARVRGQARSAGGARERESFQVVAGGDVHAHRWEVDLCAVTLASLGSRRSSLSRDYDELLAHPELDIATTRPSSPFDALFSPEPKAPPDESTEPLSVEQLLVLPADDAQARAVTRAVRGDSFIIQGPPGTGKSQTITNLIAALVAEGKRVLFVCEKRAALDVVAHRLRQVGLGELVATIHDSQLDRKEFIHDLGATYEAWLADDVSATTARDDALAALRSALAPLERVFLELHDARGGRRSLAEVIERLVALRVRGVGDVAVASADRIDAGVWLALRDGLDRVARARSDGSGSLAGADVLRVSPTHLAPNGHLNRIEVTIGDPVVVARELGARLGEAAAAFVAALGSGIDPAQMPVLDLDDLHAWWETFRGMAAAGALPVLDRASGLHLDARAAQQRRAELQAAADGASSVSERWSTPLPADDARAALAIAQAKEDSFLKFLSGPWRTVKSLTRAAYRWDLHQIEPPVSHVLAELVAWHDAVDAVARHDAEVTTRFGTPYLDSVVRLADLQGDDPFVVALAAGRIDVAALGRPLAALVDTLGGLVVGPHDTVADLPRIAAALSAASVSDERGLIAWAGLTSHEAADLESVLATVLGSGASLDEIERQVLAHAIEHASGAMQMSGAMLDDTVDQVLRLYRELLDANARHVRSRAQEVFREHVAFSEASMAGRSDDDKEAKRAYRAGRKVVEREFQKKMRYRSIRELASDEPGMVVRDLKPVWLMSPLSVSDTLPLDDTSFDVVVFDEASQIPVEDAVPTLFRGAQTVVVGDRMQLPPTRFFSTDADDEDEIDVVDDGGHRMTVTLDADSFLTQADLALDSSMLTWHYRSRSESLIAYSNHAFYDARLLTIPDRVFDDEVREPIVVQVPEEARSRMADLLARPISFHTMVDGRYEDRRNAAEADYIAELVRSLLEAETGLTLGVVAFSEAQQTQIESSLAELAMVDPDFAVRYEDEVVRTDDGEFVGLFVKNLENVQGDERDIIIMSVCYGPGPDGKIRMNFGPINQSGGERRLNVIFSRAKRHMAIVSSMRGGDITNTHNDGAAHLARFLDYAAAESGGGAGGDPLLRSLRVPDVHADAGDASSSAARRSAVAAELAERLRAVGLAVDVGVGRSGFTVDVAVRGDDGYRLGVVVDPGPPDATLTERMVAEAGVLSAFGWPITRVLVSEWWTDPDTVVDRVLAAASA